MKGHRLWCRVAAHGGTIPVYVTKAPIFDDDGTTELDAYYEKDAPRIVVKQTDNVAAMQQRLHHELLHVCFGAHSGDGREQVFKGRTPAARGKHEELIVSFLEPIQFDLLVRNGWLRYPKPPRVK